MVMNMIHMSICICSFNFRLKSKTISFFNLLNSNISLFLKLLFIHTINAATYVFTEFLLSETFAIQFKTFWFFTSTTFLNIIRLRALLSGFVFYNFRWCFSMQFLFRWRCIETLGYFFFIFGSWSADLDWGCTIV